MATIYYPSSSSLYSRVIAGGLSELSVNVAPDTIFILSGSSNFTTSLVPQLLLTASTYDITASWAVKAIGGGAGGIATASFYQFPVQSAKLSTTQSARLNNGGTCWELLFNQNEGAVWQMHMPVGYSGSLVNHIQWYATGSATGAKQVLWNVRLTTVTPGASTVVSQSYPNFEVLGYTSSFNQSGSWLQETDIWLSGSPITSSDMIIYRLERGTGSADTAVGAIAVVNNIFEWVRG